MKINQLTLCISIWMSVFLFAHYANAQPTDFYDDLLDQKSIDATRNLIFLDITFKEYRGRAAITNGDLYVYLKLTKNLDVKEYNSFMIELIKNKKILAICDSHTTRNGRRLRGGVFEFILLNKDYGKVDELTKKSKDDFITYFFVDRLMKSTIVKEYNDFGIIYAVADKLFQWQIVTQIDDPTGLLALSHYPNEVK